MMAKTADALQSGFGYTSATAIQAAALPEALEGKDMIAQARTGTGKTIAFLIPVVQRESTRRAASAGGIGVLVISPTRELAEQIRREAEVIGGPHGVSTVVVMGGTNMKAEARRLAGGCGILVATPGRLLDHIENTRGFQESLRHMHSFVLDECDRLLDMGFRPEIRKISRHIPAPATRQTLLFSATMPAGVKEVAAEVLRPSPVMVSTVDPHAAPTHEIVAQEGVVAPPCAIAPTIWRILAHHTTVAEPTSFKVIAFFPTARMAQFFAAIFRAALPAIGVAPSIILDVHSRKSQAQRMRAADTFKSAPKAILFSSDVSARGMDFPDVTMVMQVGLTDREQYIHRLGRTARAGKAGRGCLVLLPDEAAHMAGMLRGLPIRSPLDPASTAIPGSIADAGLHLAPARGGPWPMAHADASGPGAGAEHIAAAIGMVGGGTGAGPVRASASDRDSMASLAAMAYSSWIGYYKGAARKVGWSPAQMVAVANDWFAGAGGLGLREVPILQRRTVGKMGLRGVPGIREEAKGSGGGGGGGGGAAEAVAAVAAAVAAVAVAVVAAAVVAAAVAVVAAAALAVAGAAAAAAAAALVVPAEGLPPVGDC
ncbi:hypothetical protein FNF28_06066 [Cafeteria roenbergensis]|uniref:ATP-dependent RNA helicase n=1 Tax=Cafeteria roenbergensis TaxID=33653 RepID=A0A5A8D4G7_CAFRO|nr:hypothetical protein FNF28_06066 [Cafeteria roenbergensis]